MKRKTWNVIALLFADQKVDRDRIHGILRWTQLHPEWHVKLLPDHPANRMDNSLMPSNVDGVITNPYTLYGYGRGAAAWQGTRNLVLFDGDESGSVLPGARQVSINSDSAACGRLAANYLSKRHIQHLAYVHMRMKRKWSDIRANAFFETARAKGLSCAIYQPSNRDQTADMAALVKWLRSLPKPCGVLGANDARAIQIVELCRQVGIAIPEQLTVMGVDNNNMACEFVRPSLTSIETQDEEAGFLAAQTLDKLMRGKTTPSRIVHGSPHIVERDSTLDPKGTARIISRARHFIDENFSRPISAADVAKAIGISRKTAERRFLQAGLDSPADELRNRRLQEMHTQILRNTTPLSEIALACGFKSYHAAQAAFLRRYNMTPRDCRKAKNSGYATLLSQHLGGAGDVRGSPPRVPLDSPAVPCVSL